MTIERAARQPGRDVYARFGFEGQEAPLNRAVADLEDMGASREQTQGLAARAMATGASVTALADRMLDPTELAFKRQLNAWSKSHRDQQADRERQLAEVDAKFDRLRAR